MFQMAAPMVGSVFSLKSKLECDLLVPPGVITPKNDGNLFMSSFARAVAIPSLIDQFRQLGVKSIQMPSKPVVFAYSDEVERITPVTIELLEQIIDYDEDYWPLVAFVTVSLGIDPAHYRYRSNSSIFEPCIAQISCLRPVRKSDEDPIAKWANLHGYVFEQEQELVVESSKKSFPSSTFKILEYTKANGRNDMVQRAYFFVSVSRVIETMPLAAKMMQFICTLRQEEGCKMAPIFIVLEQISNFSDQWTLCKKMDRVFPTTMRYFDIEDSDHYAYPRFVPVPKMQDKIPIFHPGPALYSWKSAPAACQFMFSTSADVPDFLCIREGYHQELVVACSADPLRLN